MLLTRILIESYPGTVFQLLFFLIFDISVIVSVGSRAVKFEGLLRGCPKFYSMSPVRRRQKLSWLGHIALDIPLG